VSDPGWDDTRIDAAFRAAFDRDAPSGLADRVMDEVVVSDRDARRQVGTRWLAVAATLVVAVVLAVGGGLGNPTVDPSASASSQPTASSSTPPPSQTAAPITAADLPVISVEEAIAIRVMPNRSDEFAVEGWMNLELASSPIYCPARIPSPSTPLLDCGLLDLYADQVEREDAIGVAHFHLRPIGLDLSWLYDDFPSKGDDPSVRVVVVGHFDDRRSPLCVDKEPLPQTARDRELLAQLEQACRDQFVVDQFLSVDGRAPSQVFIGNTITAWSHEEALTAVADYVPTLSILSTDAIPGGSIGIHEPALVDGLEDLTSKKVLWTFRVLVEAQPARVDTYIVVDGIGSVFRSVGTSFERVDGWVEPEGPPYASVDLDDGPGIGALAEIWDRSGTLIWRRVATADDPAILGNIEGVRVTTLAGLPSHVRLTWYGGVCENYRVVVERRATIIRILAVPKDMRGLLCPAAAVQRDLILMFGQPTGPLEAELVTTP
jgi:hypothetical protein